MSTETNTAPEVKPAHTPGPWVALCDFGFPKEVRTKETGELVATVRPNHKCGVENTLLIAAAPEMLAALKLADAIFTAFGPEPETCDERERDAWLIIRAAIAKATTKETAAHV